MTSVRSALLSVDDAGEYWLVAGDRLTLGHVRAGRADLRFLADVGAEHAVLERRDSFRDGLRWEVRPLGNEAVRVGERRLGPDGVRLEAGDVLRLGSNLALLYGQPDPASTSVLLELRHDSPGAGPRRIVLLGEGEGGRVRLGGGEQRHVRVSGWETGVGLWLEGERLHVRPEAPGAEGLSLPFPPPERVHLALTRREGGAGPPLGLSLSPVPEGL